MPTSQTTTLDSLNEALATLDQQYHGTYRTPEAIYALMKTIKTFNITITDWNTLIDYINVVGLTLDALYAVIPELVAVINNDIENSDAANKSYVDAGLDDKVDKVTTSSFYQRAYIVKVDGTQGTIQLMQTPFPFTIAQYSSNSTLQSEAPVNNKDVVNKQYVDNAIGGTLRQCLCVKESLDFDNTDAIDLGTLSWENYLGINGVFRANVSGIKGSTTATNNGKLICSKYKTNNIQNVSSSIVNNAIAINNDGTRLYVSDTSLGTNATTFKNAMKGVLLAYEKASS